ncbi:rhodanese-like domain-containing protein [Marinifilum caeruleilacunae]|uniref:Rhodanese-like domain-containing protein n=1 Tax=Marinifilum caeruleilacunae TaxID=2499076 RepID=A0ABX1WS99_9BACT|nr:rhodanese-like domain-containing protein [Marinifilum caeruleilacunae]NOU58975.1 rhodanese-like domain-containing protein [Marinifilum caeruleilacunae]
MKMRLILASVFIPLGIIIAAIPENTTKPFKLTAEQLLDEVKDGTQFVSTDEIADMLVQKDPSLQLIDVRSQAEFEKYSLPGAINIPLTQILSEEYEEYVDQGIKMNVFYSNGNLKANEAWMLTRQLGYENNFVMQGGLNYWAETILNPQAPKSVMADDEIAKYDFRKGASAALGGDNAVLTNTNTVKKPKPTIKKRKKKKRVSGGC